LAGRANGTALNDTASFGWVLVSGVVNPLSSLIRARLVFVIVAQEKGWEVENEW
jgi:hypothetical protein